MDVRKRGGPDSGLGAATPSGGGPPWFRRWRARELTASEAANLRAARPPLALWTASLGGHPPRVR